MTEKFKQLEIAAEAKARRLASEFQEKTDSLKNRIGELEREKVKIRDGRVSKAEAVQRMKEDLKKGFDFWIMEKFIKPNLNTYQSGHYRPLHDFDHLKVHQLANTEWLFFLFSWVDPAWVDQAAESFEEGPDQKQRAKAIADLDKKIEEAEKELEGLLK
jgi:hypothetical protein